MYVAASGAVRLVDFNPLGGTTAPLLFSWGELLPGAPLGAGGEGAEQGLAAVAPAAQEEERQQQQQQEQGARSRVGAMPPPDYLEQLRRVRALSLADASTAAAAGAGAAVDAAETPPATAASGGAGCCGNDGDGGGGNSGQLELRIVEEAVALRPHTLAYGVPYDFVDASEGSALDRLAQVQQAQQQQDGGGGAAGELWAALQRRADSGGQSGAAPAN